MKSQMISTEITFDAVFQIHIKLPVEVTKEEAMEVLHRDYHQLILRANISRPKIANAFKIPWYFVVTNGYLDTAKIEDMQIVTYREDRE